MFNQSGSPDDESPVSVSIRRDVTGFPACFIIEIRFTSNFAKKIEVGGTNLPHLDIYRFHFGDKQKNGQQNYLQGNVWKFNYGKIDIFGNILNGI